MLKRIGSFSLVLVVCLFFAATAFAEMRDFPKFRMNVPSGWTVEQDEDSVNLTAADKSAALSIAVGDSEGKTAAALAEEFSKELEGSKPVAVEDGAYHFTFKAGEVESDAVITVEGKEYALFVITGEHPDLEKMMDSVEQK